MNDRHILRAFDRDLEGIQAMVMRMGGMVETAIMEAAEALELFCFRIAGEIARLAATLGGLDAVVFTAGVGENQPPVRAAVARRLNWLGLKLEDAANVVNARSIGAAGARVKILVIATDEESVIADEALSVLQPDSLAARRS